MIQGGRRRLHVGTADGAGHFLSVSKVTGTKLSSTKNSRRASWRSMSASVPVLPVVPVMVRDARGNWGHGQSQR